MWADVACISGLMHASYGAELNFIVDILLLESLIPEAMAWLEARHSLQYRPQLVSDERALRHSTGQVRAIVVPNQVVINAEFLDFSPKLERRLNAAGCLFERTGKADHEIWSTPILEIAHADR